MELKGIITLGRNVSLTCCESIQDIQIGGESLYDAIDNYLGLDPEHDYNNKRSAFLRYVIMDKEQDDDFDTLKGKVIAATIVGEFVGGCYSEYTCGWGGFDYFHKEKGHSIFSELRDEVSKYIHIIT